MAAPRGNRNAIKPGGKRGGRKIGAKNKNHKPPKLSTKTTKKLKAQTTLLKSYDPWLVIKSVI